MISNPAELAELLPLISIRTSRVAIDTEADSLHCYREKLCLLQVSLPEGDFLLDPLAENDLSATGQCTCAKGNRSARRRL